MPMVAASVMLAAGLPLTIASQKPASAGSASPTAGTTFPGSGPLLNPACACARDAAVLPTGVGANEGYVLDGYGNIASYGGAPPVVGPSFPSDIARAIKLRVQGGGYVLDGWGGIQPFGGAPPVSGGPYWPGQDIARDLIVLAGGTTGYVLDGWGGIHPYGGAPGVTSGPYWPGQDVARRFLVYQQIPFVGVSGYVLDDWGGIHPFTTGAMPSPPPIIGAAYWPGQDVARDFVLIPGTSSGYTLDDWGGLHPFNGAVVTSVQTYPYWAGQDIARAVLVDSAGSGFVLTNSSALHRFGVSVPTIPPISASRVGSVGAQSTGGNVCGGSYYAKGHPNSTSGVEVFYYGDISCNFSGVHQQGWVAIFLPDGTPESAGNNMDNYSPNTGFSEGDWFTTQGTAYDLVFDFTLTLPPDYQWGSYPPDNCHLAYNPQELSCIFTTNYQAGVNDTQ